MILASSRCRAVVLIEPPITIGGCAHSRSDRFELLSIAPFHVILSTLIITIVSTFVRGSLSNLIKDYFYDFQIKPRVNFLFRGLNSLGILFRCLIFFCLLFFLRRCCLRKTKALRGCELPSARAEKFEDYCTYVGIKP